MILRRPEGLFRLTILSVESHEPPRVDAPLDLGDPFEEVVAPLDDAEARLARVREGNDDPDTLAAIFDLLVETVPDPGAWSRNLVLPSFDEDTKPRRTAAHPRGFRGTKWQPPKPSSRGPIDLLPFLDGGHHEAALLQRLGRHREQAVARSKFAEVLEMRGETVLRPFGQAWSAEVGERIAAMPAEFRRLFAWGLRGFDMDACATLIASYWALGLDHDDRLRRSVARICVLPTARALRWVRVLEQVAPHRRTVLAELAIETDADLGADLPDLQETIERAEALCDDRHYRHRMHHLLVALAERRSPIHLLDGFELANEFGIDHGFDVDGEVRDEVRDEVRGSLESVRRVMRAIGDPGVVRTSLAMPLWERCGQIDGFTARLDAFAAISSRLEPAWRGKAYDHLAELLWSREDLAQRLFELLPRLCGPPFAQASHGLRTLHGLCRIADTSWRAILTAPEASFLRLEAETARTNDDSLIAAGLGVLAEHMPELVASGFVECPVVLLASGKTLGCISEAAATALLRTLHDTPLFAAHPETLDAAALIRLIDASGDPAARSLIARRLREHVEGRAEASPGQVERATARLRIGWPRVLLARIEAAVIEQLAANLGAPAGPYSSAERHALLFQNEVAEHRRAVRKLLAAHFAGDHEYLIRHPVNQRWLASHDHIDARTWTRGFEHHHGDRVLAIQSDPLEVLRMGTHVGTCLGLGGGLGYSAAAIVLDVNKQVIECRDRRGSVLARQLVALSDDEQLVCFEVYPLASDESIQRLFFDYDRALAAALGVAIHAPSDDDPIAIALLLAQAWWFDDPVAVPPAP